MSFLLFMACVFFSEDPVFLEMEVPRDSYYVQEPIELTLRVGFDEAFFADHAIQLFRRRLDLPVQVDAGWIENLPGTIALEAGDADKGMSFVLNDRVVVAERIGRRGRYTVLERVHSFLPNNAGDLAIPAPAIRFAQATSFFEDLVTGRVPADRKDVSVKGNALKLYILPLPEDGRPPEFTGAVGRFTVSARADVRALRLGESLRCSLEVEGKGNLMFFRAPRLEGLGGFHVYGHIDEKSNGTRTITYDMAPLDEAVTVIPSIPFTYFDPGPPAGYHIVRTRPIPLEVKPIPEGVKLTLLTEYGRPVPGVNDLFSLKPVRGGGPRAERSLWITAAVLCMPWLLALGLLQWLQKREREKIDPLGARARRAAALYRERAGTDPSRAFTAYLSARLRCPDAAVITPDLALRLEENGVPAELSERAAAAQDRLVSNRYGGKSLGVEETADLVRALEEVFLSVEEES